MTPARQVLARIRLEREPALLAALLGHLCDRGRILPEEELHRELWGETVAHTLPEAS